MVCQLFYQLEKYQRISWLADIACIGNISPQLIRHSRRLRRGTPLAHVRVRLTEPNRPQTRMFPGKNARSTQEKTGNTLERGLDPFLPIDQLRADSADTCNIS